MIMVEDTRHWEVVIEISRLNCPYRYLTKEMVRCLNEDMKIGYDKQPGVGSFCCLEYCPIKIGQTEEEFINEGKKVIEEQDLEFGDH